VLASGQDKARAVREALEGDYSPEAAPAQLLRNARGRVIWIIDKNAAGGLAAFGGTQV
ncbi:MAG: 6-phosphogluconolactonase, partial [Deltaproteobacteria bacterium]|nr:6-phosphogluconolactonase [Deltaproteobacteria bacterium]